MCVVRGVAGARCGASEAARPAVTREPLHRVHSSVARHPTPHARPAPLTARHPTHCPCTLHSDPSREPAFIGFKRVFPSAVRSSISS